MINANITPNGYLKIVETITSDSILYEKIKFTFPDNWDGYTKTAVFTQGNNSPVSVILNGDNSLCTGNDECYIPFEVIKTPEFSVSVFGIKDDSRITTQKAFVNVIESGYANGDTPAEPTQSVYQQILNTLHAPYIGDNGYWYEFDKESNQYIQKCKSQGDTGSNGTDGVSVTGIQQTSASSSDNGNNIITVTLSDNTTSTFTVKNGSKGSSGTKGADGVKGDKGDKGDSALDVTIPSYWDSAIATAITSARALQDNAGHDCISFIWFSDVHYLARMEGVSNPTYPNYTNNLGLLSAYLMKNLGIPVVICSGDITENAVTNTESCIDDDVSVFLDKMKYVDLKNMIACRGNHEGSWGNKTIDGSVVSYVNNQAPEKLYNRYFRWQSDDFRREFSDDGSYFYVDDKAQRVRYIVLNSHWCEYSANADGTAVYNVQKNIGYGQTQLDWLALTALNMADDTWTAIIVTHAPLADLGSAYVTSSRDTSILNGILDSKSKRTTYTGSYTGTSTWDSVNVSLDFSETFGNIAGVFCGHCHKDSITSTYNYPIITIDCAGNYSYTTNAPTRTLNSATETAFDIVTINKKTHAINMTRCGVGSDRSTTYSPYVPIINLFDATADGYEDSTRTNSSGTTSAQTNAFMVNYIPATKGKYVNVQLENSTDIAGGAVLGGYVYTYNSSKELVSHSSWGTTSVNAWYEIDSSNVFHYKVGYMANTNYVTNADNIAYVRFAVFKNASTGITESNLSVTVTDTE